MKEFKEKSNGRLYYLIGPSGSGKDSLISYARDRLKGDDAIVFAHRYITRPPQKNGENHIALSEEEFSQRLAKGFFSMHWQSHGYYYGIGVEIDLWLSRGCRVLVNGSRYYLPKAKERYSDLKVILIDVSHTELSRRLEARGRETTEQIKARLERNRQLKNALIANISDTILITNNGALEAAGEMLVQHLS
jgi:ribose 1,5-bisphosphokinase